MKNLILGWLSIAVVLSLFICAPLPVLACGGGGGGGGGGEAGLGGPQSSTASSPTSSTFTKPSVRQTLQEIFEAERKLTPEQKKTREIEQQKLRDRRMAEMRQERLEREAGYWQREGDRQQGYETAATYATYAGTFAQAFIAVATAGTSTWLQTAGKVLLSGARGAADGYAYAANKGEGEEMYQAILSGGTAATIEAATSPFNPYVGIGGSVMSDLIMHSDPVENKAPRPVPVQDLTYQPVQDMYGQPIQR